MFQNSYVEIMTNINSNEISQLQYEVNHDFCTLIWVRDVSDYAK